MWAFQTLSPPQFSFPPKNHSNKQHKISSSLTKTNLQLSNNNNNQLIQSLCKQGNLKQALQILSNEPLPSQRTYEHLILSCTHQNFLADVVTVHRHLVDNGFDQDPFLATKLIDGYACLDSIENARYVFDKMRKRTVFVFNAFIRALALAGFGEDAVCVYREMNESGVGSDRFTYTYVLKACVCLSSRSWGLSLCVRKGKEVHGHVLRHGFESNVHVGTTLLDFYARYGCVWYAGNVFDTMPVRNVVSWSAMIACLVKNGRSFEALKLFWEMEDVSLNLGCNSVTMVSVIQACAALAALGQGKLIHCYVLRKGLNSILPVTNSLISMYSRCGSIEIARCIFDQMDNRDVVSWNAIISGYGIHGNAEEAIMLFEEMIRRGFSPNKITFVSVLGACSHAGLIHKGRKLFDSMAHVHNIFPSEEHYACIVDMLGRAGRLDEAVKVVDGMRIEPGPPVWGSLLGACRIHCNVELAERASLRLFEIEPMNAGNYVLLADIYAEARMWEEVNKVKKLLESSSLQKIPGCSWIEVKRKIYSFMSIDEVNPQTEQLHSLLVQLLVEMKERGYVPETKFDLCELDQVEKENIVLGHSEKLAVAFGLINSSNGETIRITKNLRLCEDCHSVTKVISKFANREILVRDVNRVHYFRDGVCSCGDYW